MRTLTNPPGFVEQAYDAILDAICEGQLSPRERLTQERVAEMLNVSRQPVGQALGLLKAQGFVCDAGRRGLMVAPLEPALVRAFYEFRSAVDPLAAAKAAAAPSDALSSAGRGLIEEGRAAAESGPVVRLIDADMAFHKLIYDVAGNPIVVDCMDRYWHHGRRVMSAVVTLDDDWPARVWSQHATILEAILAGRGDEAARLARAHVLDAGEALIARLPEGDRELDERAVHDDRRGS